MIDIEVIKYGGSSVSDKEKIDILCIDIKKKIDKGKKIVIIVSAMGKTTDELEFKSSLFSGETEFPKEKAVLLCTGELQSAALFSMSLNRNKVSANVMTPFECNLLLKGDYLDSNFCNMKGQVIFDLFKRFNAIVIPGFHGFDENNVIKLLGRGGSDTTAVAVSASLGLKKVSIYSDVDGVYTADPKIVKNSKMISELDYNIMKVMSDSGAKVLHSKCIDIAMKKNISIHCKGSFIKGNGTIIKKIKHFNKKTPIAIVSDISKALVILSGVSCINKIMDNFINYEQIILSNEKVFVFPKKTEFLKFMDNIAKKHININMEYKLNIAKISIVGYGFNEKNLYKDKILDLLKKDNIDFFAQKNTKNCFSVYINEGLYRRVTELFHYEFIEKKIKNI
ncbi:MAG: hypothetical protein M0R46_02125 [Candidatus Muirbacterium halophilum]|nr:hypothetical protein [Candidatus Muirbacterium halophilum]MCK9474686.1 hypothetical protein [Candidatus Muirbacterium halophilum]